MTSTRIDERELDAGRPVAHTAISRLTTTAIKAVLLLVAVAAVISAPSPPWLGKILLLSVSAHLSAVVLLQAFRPKFIRLHGWKSIFRALAALPAALLQIGYVWLALVVLTLVWWTISVLLAGLVDRLGWSSVTPTTVFLIGVISLYSTFLLRGFLGGGVNAKFRHVRLSDEELPDRRKRVAIIGAGMAGLVATKELKEEGHDVVVFERTEGWGGVWAGSKKRGGRAWSTTSTSTGSLNSTFSDCPMPIYNEENGVTPLHFSRQQFLDMLVSYNDRYSVFDDCLRTETEVTSIRQLDGGRWEVMSESDGTSSVESFDALTICTGLNHEPWTPDLPGRGSFRGRELHVDDYDPTQPDAYAGKRVLIVGIGETAADLARELADNGAGHIYAAPRNPTLTLDRNFGSLPPDYVESRLVYSGPMFNRWALLLSSLPAMLTNRWGPSRTPTRRARDWFRLLRPQDTIKAFPSVIASANTTKSDNLWHVLDQGRGTLTKPIAAVSPSGVMLSDGSDLAVDAIVYCTGYRTKNSFLPPIADDPGQGEIVRKEPLSARQLYKLTIHPDYENVAVIGFARGLVGAITVSSEMQARWWALLVSGKRTLPSVTDMRADIDYLGRKGGRFGQPARATMTFANSLARNEIGCEPDMFALFRTDLRLWWQTWSGVICNSHYRIHGVHAKPDLARQQLLMPYSLHDPRYRDSVDMFYNIVPLSLLLIPAWSLLDKVLPGFATRSALNSYI